MRGQAEKWFRREIDIGLERMCSAGMRFRPYSEDDQTAMLGIWVEILWSGARWGEALDKERIFKTFALLIQNFREFPTVPDFKEALVSFPRPGIECHVPEKTTEDHERAAENWRQVKKFLAGKGPPEFIRVDKNDNRNSSGK